MKVTFPIESVVIPKIVFCNTKCNRYECNIFKSIIEIGLIDRPRLDVDVLAVLDFQILVYALRLLLCIPEECLRRLERLRRL